MGHLEASIRFKFFIDLLKAVSIDHVANSLGFFVEIY